MLIYKQGANGITLSGQTFTSDENGIIDVPAHLAGNAFTQGFVSAAGRIKQIAGQAMADNTAAAPAPVPAKPNKPTEKPL